LSISLAPELVVRLFLSISLAPELVVRLFLSISLAQELVVRQFLSISLAPQLVVRQTIVAMDGFCWDAQLFCIIVVLAIRQPELILMALVLEQLVSSWASDRKVAGSNPDWIVTIV
jgi:hypothetical protein